MTLPRWLRLRPFAKDPELAAWHLGAGRLNWLAVCLTLVIAPHGLRMPPWIGGLFLMLCLWRLWRVRHGDERPPNRWLVILIALSIVPGVYASYGTITGREAGVALLTLLSGIKLLEARGIRDAYVLSYLGYFLVITNFLFDQSITTGLYMLAVVVVMTASLMALGSSPGHSSTLGIAAHLRRSALLVLQAVPLMLVLFVLFPRIPGPLWGLPKDAWSGVTGLSDDMTPGNISSLSESDAVAFRVTFRGEPPPPALRYWRGPVLDVTDGRRWSRGERALSRRPVRFQRLGDGIHYEVTLEPHGKRWMFGLDLPAAIPVRGVMSPELEIRATRNVRERLRYRLVSYARYALEPERPFNPWTVLSLPPGVHPRARALALDWREALKHPQAVVDHALRWFREQGFVYSLTPPRLSGDPVDDFLFGTREGFCEHYAASFVVLMRAAGIPARVVTGYQGGEMNPLGDYMLVRQRDAHAWAEVWIQGKGWIRVDPTAVVAPVRIAEGMDAAIPRTLGPRGLGITPTPVVADTFRRLRQALDAVQTNWNAWVLGYGTSRQRQMLSRIGLDGSSTGSLVLALTVVMTVVLAALAAWMFRRRVRRDPVRALYDTFCARLARRGVARRPEEGPRDFARRAAAERPEMAGTIHAITEAYVALRYAGREGGTAELRRQIGAFRP